MKQYDAIVWVGFHLEQKGKARFLEITSNTKGTAILFWHLWRQNQYCFVTRIYGQKPLLNMSVASSTNSGIISQTNVEKMKKLCSYHLRELTV